MGALEAFAKNLSDGFDGIMGTVFSILQNLCNIIVIPLMNIGMGVLILFLIASIVKDKKHRDGEDLQSHLFQLGTAVIVWLFIIGFSGFMWSLV